MQDGEERLNGLTPANVVARARKAYFVLPFKRPTSVQITELVDSRKAKESSALMVILRTSMLRPSNNRSTKIE